MSDFPAHDLIELRRDGQPWLISARAIASVSINGSGCMIVPFTTDDNNVLAPASYINYVDTSYADLKKQLDDLKK